VPFFEKMYGQLVVGPPGCGKTTYCRGMKEFYTQIQRTTVIVNLDPGNEGEFDVDVNELISLQHTMETYKLGPNGGLLYCMEYLEQNLDWLLARIPKNVHVLFDLPGQVELFTNHAALRNVILFLVKNGFMVLVF
jgi:GTPase SAR1 family protein